MVEQGQELAIVESVLDYHPDSPAKVKYVSYRACGFTIDESLRLSGVEPIARQRWLKSDDLFRAIERHITSLRKIVGIHYAFVELLRNYRLALDKDFKVLSAAAADEPLTDRDFQYLMRIRGLYTPEQMGKMQQLVTGQSNGDAAKVDFNFTQVVLSMARKEVKIDS